MKHTKHTKHEMIIISVETLDYFVDRCMSNGNTRCEYDFFLLSDITDKLKQYKKKSRFLEQEQRAYQNAIDLIREYEDGIKNDEDTRTNK